MSKIALVTGGTSGIGKETALYLAKNGCTVYELSRRAEGVAGLRHISADVTDEASVRRAVEQILQEAGQIDILVNNAGFGITVCAVMPGDIQTGFTAARRKVAEGDEIYAGRISRSVKRMEHDEQTGMDPAKAGAFVGRVALKTGHKPLYTIGFAYKAAVFLTKVLPAGALNWLIGKIYAS